MDCIVYPFSESAISIVKYWIKNRKYNIKKLVTPKAWMNIKGQVIDGGKFNNGYKIGVSVSNDFEQEMQDCETVIFVDSMYTNYMRDDLLRKMSYSIENSKNVVCCIELECKEEEYFDSLGKENKVTFEIKKGKICCNETLEDRFYKPEAIIIGVGKLIDELDSSFTIIECINGYREEGYKAVAITTNKNLCAIDCCYYPDKLMKSGLNECEKVLYFNQFIRFVEQNEMPDIIIIDMPTAMMKYSGLIQNQFGVLPYIISQAVDIDYFILVAHIDAFNFEFYKKISQCFKYRFGYEIDVINVMNVIMDISDSVERRKASCNYVPLSVLLQYIENVQKESKIKLYDPQDEKACRNMIKEAIDKLSYCDCVM